MKDFAGKFAVVTGGGTGMGRELVRQLVAEGCSVAMCDVSEKNMAQTKALCEADGVPQGVRITTHLADVSSEDDLIRFRDAAAKAHDTDKLHLLFNNAGIGGGASIVKPEARGDWEKTFNVCWGGVYFGVRTFLPMLQRADAAHIINTSSINGFWASIGPGVAHTAYSAAKFAVKGFSEALINDLATYAPNIHVSVVMPGHIGTEISANSRKVLRNDQDDKLGADELPRIRARFARSGRDTSQLTDEELQALVDEQSRRFLEDAPTSAAQAAKIILDGVKADQWRILVGDDAHLIDRMVRDEPEAAYGVDFYERYSKANGRRIGGFAPKPRTAGA